MKMPVGKNPKTKIVIVKITELDRDGNPLPESLQPVNRFLVMTKSIPGTTLSVHPTYESALQWLIDNPSYEP